MPKAMIITVGTGETVSHGICFSIRQQNPELVVFINTQESKEKTMPAILKNETMEGRKYEEKELSDENDVEKIKFECERIIKEIRKEYNPEEIVCDFTSGTKAMSSALVFSALEEKLGTLVYVVGDRDKNGRAISGTERAIPLSPNRIFAEDLFKNAIEMFNNCQFDTCIKTLRDAKNLIAEDEFQQKASVLERLALAYSNWDRFKLKGAFDTLNNLQNAEQIFTDWGIKNRIKKNKQILHKEKENKFCHERMVDLFENSKRRAEEYKFDDAVARLYRALEYIAQYFIAEKELYQKKNNDFDTAKLNLDKLPKNIREKYKEMVGLDKSYELLNDLQHPIGSKIHEQLKNKNGELKKLLTLRNNSILAHGFNPVKKDNYEKMLSLVENYLKSIIKDFERVVKDISFPKIKL